MNDNSMSVGDLMRACVRAWTRLGERTFCQHVDVVINVAQETNKGPDFFCLLIN